MAEKIREEILQEIKNYFDGEQWMTMEERLENDPDNSYHAHIFVDTTLNPLTFSDVLRVYHKARGMEVDRPIDLQPSNVGHNMLHGVHPYGTFHYDLAWKYEPGVVIKPMSPEFVKEKNNLQIWGKTELDEFFLKFAFVHPTGEAKKELDDYFESDDWKQTVEYVMDDTITHFHSNVETSFHPDDIRDAALVAFKKQGWTLQKRFHCIFSVLSGKTGKIVFLLDEPRVMFDIAWKFNSDVGIRQSTVPFMGVTEGVTKFDVRRKETMEFYTNKGEFITLSDAELKTLGTMFPKK